MQKLIFLFLALACFVRADVSHIVVSFPFDPSSSVDYGAFQTDCLLADGAVAVENFGCFYDNNFPGFKDIVSQLTNGVNDGFYAEYTLGYGSAFAFLGDSESDLFARYTKNGVDLAGYKIRSISFYPGADFMITPYDPDPNYPGTGWLNISGSVDMDIRMVPEYASPLDLAVLSAVVLGFTAIGRRRLSLAGPRAR
jgi:hypothetical protein